MDEPSWATYKLFHIAAEGFDGGVRAGEPVEHNMIAVRITEPLPRRAVFLTLPSSTGRFSIGSITRRRPDMARPDSSNHHASHHDHGRHAHHYGGWSLNKTAFQATVHCLIGCAIGEVLGMVIGTALEFGNLTTIALAVILAFLFGYAFTFIPLIRSGLALRTALSLAFASDTISITIMEIVDNVLMLAIPGAMDAGLGSMLFWASLTASLIVAGAAAYPVNRWLIARGRGHAVVHQYHQ